MNSFDDWSQIISKYLKSESGPLSSLAKHKLDGGAARTAFIRSVLDRLLPETYGVGAGQVMDSNGNMTEKLDIIVYRRDFPRLDLPGSQNIYLYESVIATFEITTKLVKKTLFDALDSCASLAELQPGISHKVMTSLAAKNQLTLNHNKQFVHQDPLHTARFHLIGRPLSFVYAFSGYQTSPNMMIETMEAWMREREGNNKPVDMKSMPAVIATQGCFAWRNSSPFTVKNNCLMGVGIDDAPVRLIIFQMLYALNRKLRVTPDSYGVKPALDSYLMRITPPQIDQYIGKAYNPVVGDASGFRKPIKKKTAKETLFTLDRKPEPVDAPFPQPNADLIPKLDQDPPEFDKTDITMPLPKLAMGESESVDTESQDDTLKVTPEAVKAVVSAQSFLKTVTMNLAGPEPFPDLQPESEPEPEPFTSTIPQ
ncbi:MAG: hypothetical protein GY784_10875 [Gammaproteobacteria bacterium]|nr:hypothetical protein [Gammaproteobacteria bacterium]